MSKKCGAVAWAGVLFTVGVAAGCRSDDRAGAVDDPPAVRAGNPVIPGWYADPEGAIFRGEDGKDRYWIYPTYSAKYDEQTFFDAFSSRDLVTWTKHPRILSKDEVGWARRAMWAPAVIEKAGRYYLFFGANDIQSDAEAGGIGVAVAERPEGPFKDLIGGPLVDRFHNGAQPIDQFVFRDVDGREYLIYGGWRRCNIARLAGDFRSIEPFEDGAMFKEITPDGYVEGPFMFMKNGKYYFMWSEGGWTGPDYRVAYAVAGSPLGPFERVGTILEQDAGVATGAGHHSVIHVPAGLLSRAGGDGLRGGSVAGRGDGSGDGDRWYIVYHRRPLGETDRNHRVVCIDRMEFDEAGLIRPVRITFEGVERAELR